jgi:hypothetical protein
LQLDQYRLEKVIPIALGKISHDAFRLDLGIIFVVSYFRQSSIHLASITGDHADIKA